MFKNKLKASLTHLLISIVVVSALLAFVFLYWYPGVLAEVSGLKQVVIIMVAIDLVLGPLLTFVVFKPKKPKLAFDLAMIGLFQISALVYATFVIYEGHPLYVTYAVDRFIVITANEVDPNQATLNIFKKSKLAGPDLAFAKQPEDSKEAERIMFNVMIEGGPDIDKRPNLYEPLDEHLDDVFSRSIDPEKLLAREDTKREFMKFIDKHGDKEDYAYLPLSGQGKDVIWALSKKTGKPVDIINVNPWAMAVNSN
ncbi:MAG: TfpX/TfpZ family type IV pilin accessory protein [Thiotrichaceae bacterium]